MDHRKIAELVDKAQKGDKNALNDLVGACYNDIYYYVLKTVKKEDLAADVTQESFLEIISTIGKLREPEAFPLWARRIAYHKCALHFRNSKEVLLEEDEEGETLLDRLPDESEEALPEQVLEDAEFRQTIMNMINSLPSEQTNALLLYYYEKLSVGEIAEIQGTTAGTVKSRLNYGRKAIKAKVEEYEKKTGTRLHGIVILPLLLRFAFGSELSAMPVISAPASLLTGAASGAGASTAAGATSATAANGAAGASTAATATTVAAKTAGAALAAKIIGGVVAGALVLGGANVGVYQLVKNTDSQSILAAFESNAETNAVPSEGLWFVPNDDRASYSVAYIGDCKDRDVVIPATHEGLPVTGIVAQAFAHCEYIHSVTIPGSVTSIGEHAFYECDFLSSVTIPGSVTSIGESAFAYCRRLADMKIPNGVISIGDDAFYQCTDLTEIAIPGSVTSIGYGVFSHCPSIESISVAKGNPVYHSSKNCLIETATKTLITGCKKSTIPSDGSVTRIGGGAFEGSSLTKITIPDGVTSIEDSAFFWSNLSSITIPSSVTSIQSGAFGLCFSLRTITYKGTKAEWQSSPFAEDWNAGAPKLTIHCTDGDIVINK